ncbi:MAG: hypothetical protein HYS27_28040 [Deltaproteobacteria bacterium]|nr:hypothetical protein [Deltaproteobacteria bacterium]
MRARDAAVPIAIAACVAFASPLHSPLNNPNEGVRVFAAKALVEQGTLAIDGVVAQWGYIDDKAKHGGHLYSSKAPLVSLLAAAGYAVIHPISGDLAREPLTRVARLFGDALPSLLIALVVWLGLRRRLADQVIADVSLVGMVLGTGVLASINVLSGHALAALVPAAVLLWARGAPEEPSRARRRRLAGLGLLLAAAVGAEYPAVLMSLPLAVLLVATDRRRDTLLWLALGALPVVLLVGAAHTAMFGAPWRTGYSFLENRQYQEVVAGTLFGIGAPVPAVLRSALLSPAVGLWFFSPLLAVGALAAAIGLRGREAKDGPRAEAVAVVVASALLLLFIAGFRGWRGGWSVGPRYVSELVGLWVVPAAVAFDRIALSKPMLARTVLAALVAIGLLHAGVAGMFFPHLSDVFANPVPEMMVPLVARGFSPSSLPLWLGAPPALACAACLLVLVLPLVLAVAAGGRRCAVGGCAAITASIVFAVVLDPLLGATQGDAGALEARRMMDNWRPEAGNPVLAADPARSPRTLLAIDRARDALPALLRDGCATVGPPVARLDVGEPLASAVSAAAPGSLLVVGDHDALALADLVGAAPVVVLRADLERWRGPLPCAGPVNVLLHEREPTPRAFAAREPLERRPLGDGWQLASFAR